MTNQQDPQGVSLPGPPRAWIARSIGILCIASGFVLGMEGLAHPDAVWLRTALALIVTGLLAQGYAFYCTIQRARSIKSRQRSAGRTSGEGKDGGNND